MYTKSKTDSKLKNAMSRLEQITKMLADDPNDTFLLFALAKEYESVNQVEKAISTYLNLRQIDPQYVGLYYHLAHLYTTAENKPEALTIYQEGIKIAREIGDQHALSELLNAKTNLEIDM